MLYSRGEELLRGADGGFWCGSTPSIRLRLGSVLVGQCRKENGDIPLDESNGNAVDFVKGHRCEGVNLLNLEIARLLASRGHLSFGGDHL